MVQYAYNSQGELGIRLPWWNGSEHDKTMYILNWKSEANPLQGGIGEIGTRQHLSFGS